MHPHFMRKIDYYVGIPLRLGIQPAALTLSGQYLSTKYQCG
jgi:hypothetical protein